MPARFLSAGFECWNCPKLATEVTGSNGLFRFIAVDPDEDWHPICGDCAKLDLVVAAGTVEIFEQYPDRTLHPYKK